MTDGDATVLKFAATSQTIRDTLTMIPDAAYEN
jgi:hypothetical protein